ncbi:MAG: hypothetical protein U0935_04140 [Pirellulales bacterium]
MAGDTIVEQTEVTYDAASNVIQNTVKQRYHNATGTGELTGPAGAQPKARVTYSASWPDPLGRQQAAADYGTNGGFLLSRPATIPPRSDTVLVTSQDYNSRGASRHSDQLAGISTCLFYDAAGRQIVMIMNCTWSSSSSSSSSSSKSSSSSDSSSGCSGVARPERDQRTSYNADGNVSRAGRGEQRDRPADNAVCLRDDVVRQRDGVEPLERKEIYPDSVDGDDEICFAYNRQGEVTSIRDQKRPAYVRLRRPPIQDRITTLAAGVDGTVRRISTSFEVRGMREKITKSWNAATVGSGSVVNEVQFAYNDFGQVIHEYQRTPVP